MQNSNVYQIHLHTVVIQLHVILFWYWNHSGTLCQQTMNIHNFIPSTNATTMETTPRSEYKKDCVYLVLTEYEK